MKHTLNFKLLVVAGEKNVDIEKVLCNFQSQVNPLADLWFENLYRLLFRLFYIQKFLFHVSKYF